MGWFRTLTGQLDLTYAPKDFIIRDLMKRVYAREGHYTEAWNGDYTRTLNEVWKSSKKGFNWWVRRFYLFHGIGAIPVERMWQNFDECNRWLLVVLNPTLVTHGYYFEPTPEMTEFIAQNWGIYIVMPNFVHHLRLNFEDLARFYKHKELDIKLHKIGSEMIAIQKEIQKETSSQEFKKAVKVLWEAEMRIRAQFDQLNTQKAYEPCYHEGSLRPHIQDACLPMFR